MGHIAIQSLGEPDLIIAGLMIWVHGREFDDAQDYHDGNWLRVSVYCSAPGTAVFVGGPILCVPEIMELRKGCLELFNGDSEKASLSPIEPNLHVSMEAVDKKGHIRVTVEITPDDLTQTHAIQFEIDQTYLPPICESCEKIIGRYPLRGV